MASYRLPDGALLVRPRIMAKTETLKRIVYISNGLPDVADDGEIACLPTDDDKLARNAQVTGRFEKFWREYMDELRLDDTLLPSPEKPSRSTNMALYLPPGRGKAWIIIAVTRWDQDTDRRLTREAGFDFHLTKPVNHTALDVLLSMNMPVTEQAAAPVRH